MGFSVDDKCKKLAKDPRAAAVVSKYSPGFTTDPQMKMVMGLTLRKLASFPQAKELADNLDAIDAELKAIEESVLVGLKSRQYGSAPSYEMGRCFRYRPNLGCHSWPRSSMALRSIRSLSWTSGTSRSTPSSRRIRESRSSSVERCT